MPEKRHIRRVSPATVWLLSILLIVSVIVISIGGATYSVVSAGSRAQRTADSIAASHFPSPLSFRFVDRGWVLENTKSQFSIAAPFDSNGVTVSCRSNDCIGNYPSGRVDRRTSIPTVGFAKHYVIVEVIDVDLKSNTVRNYWALLDMLDECDCACLHAKEFASQSELLDHLRQNGVIGPTFTPFQFTPQQWYAFRSSGMPAVLGN